MSFWTTNQADDDIADLFVYGAQRFGLAQAETYEAGLFETFDLLAANPLIAREHPELRPPARLHPYGAHLIVYLVNGAGILIVRVLHGRRDWESLLS